MTEVNFLAHTLETLVQMGIFITSVNLTSFLIGNYSLKLKNKQMDSIIREFPPIDGESIEKRKSEISEKQIKILLPYLKKLEEYTSEENLKTAYRNLKTVEVVRNPKMFLKFQGCYSSDSNKIQYVMKKTLCHEFLHMASAYCSKKTKELFGGFLLWRNKLTIGVGLNEGYTELLASRLEKRKPIFLYRKLAKIAELLEYFFDDPKEMEDYYFNHNLAGLIKHLEQFATRKEIINFILQTDRIVPNTQLCSIFSEYQYMKLELMLYEWLKRKEKNSRKVQEFKRKITSDKIVSIFLNKKIKSQRKSLKGTPIFLLQEDSKDIETKLNEEQIKDRLEIYEGRPFDEVYCKVFNKTKDNINVVEATKLFCLMMNIEFPKHNRIELNNLFRKVQCLVLPESEKTELEYETGMILQEDIDSIWLNKIGDVDSKQKTKKCQ